MLEALPQILPGVDKDVVSVVLRSFKGRGIDVRTGVKVTGHTPGLVGHDRRTSSGGDDARGRRRHRLGRPPPPVGRASASTAPG